MSRTVEFHTDPRRGLTLVELLVAIVIFTAILASVMLMFNSVTNSVRRSYRTMDAYDQARSALLSVERDIQVTFPAPATGSNLQFYGEPHGFVLIGISPNQTLGRLTYVVHRDTSRMTDPGTGAARGEQVTLSRNWYDVANQVSPVGDFIDNELNLYYPGPEVPSTEGEPPAYYMDFEVEIVYGLLLRFYENEVTGMDHFSWLKGVLENPPGMPHVPRPLFTAGSEGQLGAADRFPWFSNYLWDYLEENPGRAVSVPWYVRDTLETIEACHYWLQLLHGPGLRPIQAWSPVNIWWRTWDLADQFWYDPYAPTGVYPDNIRRLLWDHVVANGFILETYLLDPGTGQRILTGTGSTVPVIGPNPYVSDSDGFRQFDPIFRYAVEASGDRAPAFNTLFNLDHAISPCDEGEGEGKVGAFEQLANVISAPAAFADAEDCFGQSLAAMASSRQFYDLGNPLQTRLPASFDITFWVVSESGVAGAPPDLFRFSQTVHMPTGYMRRGRAVN